MKRFILLLASTMYVYCAGAQPVDLPGFYLLPPYQQEDVKLYLKQAKTAKIAGWSFCIGGAVMAAIGSLMVIESEKGYGNNNNPGNMDETGTAMVFAGAAIAGFSFRFFRRANSNTDRVRYILKENRKAYVSPGFSPASQTASIKLVIRI